MVFICLTFILIVTFVIIIVPVTAFVVTKGKKLLLKETTIFFTSTFKNLSKAYIH